MDFSKSWSELGDAFTGLLQRYPIMHQLEVIIILTQTAQCEFVVSIALATGGNIQDHSLHMLQWNPVTRTWKIKNQQGAFGALVPSS